MLEGNFRAGEHEDQLRALPAMQLAQILCRCAEGERQARIAARQRDATRHSGHAEARIPPDPSNDRWLDLPGERFGFFELTDQRGGETLDRIPVVKGEIRIADRAYLQPDRIAAVLDAGADILVRAGWKNARWLDAEGEPVDLLAALRKAAASGRIDRSIWVARKAGAPLRLRLVAIRKTAPAAAAGRHDRSTRINSRRPTWNDLTCSSGRAAWWWP